MSKSSTRCITVSLISFLICFFLMIFLFYLGDVVIEYIPADRHILFRKIMSIIVFLFGSTGIISGMYHLFVKFKLI